MFENAERPDFHVLARLLTSDERRALGELVHYVRYEVVAKAGVPFYAHTEKYRKLTSLGLHDDRSTQSRSEQVKYEINRLKNGQNAEIAELFLLWLWEEHRTFEPFQRFIRAVEQRRKNQESEFIQKSIYSLENHNGNVDKTNQLQSKENEYYINVNQQKSPLQSLILVEGTDDDTWLNPFNHEIIQFAGRTDEMSRLDQFVKVEAGFKIWAVIGPSGAGKTRLASEWMKRWGAYPDWDVGFPRDRKSVV